MGETGGFITHQTRLPKLTRCPVPKYMT